MKVTTSTYGRKVAAAGGAAVIAASLSVGSMGAAAPAFAYQSGGHGHVGLGPRVSTFAHGSGGGAGVSAFVHSLQRGASGLP